MTPSLPADDEHRSGQSDAPPSPPVPTEIPLPLDPRRLAKFFAFVIPLIVIFGAAANYAVYNLAPDPDHPVADVLKRFDLGHEPSIPALYSATVMLMISGVLLFFGHFDRSDGGRHRRGWLLLAALFLCLGIDEVVMFHEMANAALERLHLDGPFYFSWILPGAIFAATIGLLSLRFLWSLHAVTRRLMVLSGMVFLSGALGMEFIAGLIFSAAENEEAAISSVSHVLIQAVEEGLEMAGMAMFLCALVNHARLVGLVISVRDNSSCRSAETT
ncbi:hypothetical protein Enr13x_38790 [Stieleria neptunia]|uniref:Frag1/DRAM/Sfk1 family protein n=1 Tax=Stieleria neptunia TaxID=2527979 RepID=A0A518HT50_9BACT|nr:hypothetical protein [Stieleria neptunia]QDV44018.1 hypothetical protein Enr13x_38790 [Stieleria neptunia]